MKKRLFGLCLTVVLVLAFAVTASADEKEGTAGWQVTFDGKKMDDNFTAADIKDEINSLEPGDTVELTITLRNVSGSQTDWYMANKVTDVLEKNNSADGGIYDYLLTYMDNATGESTTLYSSEKFGGTGKYPGLSGAAQSLEEYFYLDRLGDGETGVVKLKVALDGETLTNNYQGTDAELRMDFAVELVPQDTDSGNPGNSGSNENGSSRNTGNRNNREVIKTGDQARVMLYVLLMLGAGLVFLLLAFVRMRRETENEYAAADGEGVVAEKGYMSADRVRTVSGNYGEIQGKSGKNAGRKERE